MKPTCWLWKVVLAVCITGTVVFAMANRAAADPIVPTYNHTYASFTDLRMSISAPTATACRQAGCSAFDYTAVAATDFDGEPSIRAAVFSLGPRVRGKDYRPAFATCVQSFAGGHQTGWDALTANVALRAGSRESWNRTLSTVCSTPTVSLVSGSNDTDDDPSPVPEPATLALLATGLVGMGLKKYRSGRSS